MANRTQAEVDAYRGNFFSAGRNKVNSTAVIAANQATLASVNGEYTLAYNDYTALINSGTATATQLDAAELRLTNAEAARNAARGLPTSQTAINNAFVWAGTNYVNVENEFFNTPVT